MRRKTGSLRVLLTGPFFLFLAILLAVIIPGYDTGREDSSMKKEVKIFLHRTGRVISLSEEEYLVGVLAAEMPASYPEEALKAQAVAARTYLYWRLQEGNKKGEPAPLCDRPDHAQGWLPREERKKKWGKAYSFFENKMLKVVQATAGEVIVWEGQLIRAYYHASCGGRTETAEEVLGKRIPYLISVTCPESNPPRETRFYSWEEFFSRLGGDVLPATSGTKGQVEVTASGRLRFLSWGGRVWAGGEVRKKLGLKSTRMEFRFTEQGVIVTTTGYGHGLGLCQRGARELALRGSDYQAILRHYYPGCQIQKLKPRSGS
ncbi:MAG: stage sporulation protein [Eubacteriales bacterium]|nr:stage sporulation protein [Eubacteriales bacterium]MDN5364086.1 stage sporulation protein [Eubacteriales bacterium]